LDRFSSRPSSLFRCSWYNSAPPNPALFVPNRQVFLSPQPCRLLGQVLGVFGFGIYHRLFFFLSSRTSVLGKDIPPTYWPRCQFILGSFSLPQLIAPAARFLPLLGLFITSFSSLCLQGLCSSSPAIRPRRVQQFESTSAHFYFVTTFCLFASDPISRTHHQEARIGRMVTSVSSFILRGRAEKLFRRAMGLLLFDYPRNYPSDFPFS